MRVESILQKVVPAKFYPHVERMYLKRRGIRYWGWKHTCPCCNGHFRTLLSWGTKPVQIACPRCYSVERYRLLLEPDLVAELARHPNIVAIKEASGNIGQISRIIEDTQDEDFLVISGDDNITLPIMALGGAGVISVAANVDPVRMVAMCEAMKQGDYQKALVLHFALSPLLRAMFIDTNPIPVKKAVELLGMAGGPVRLPLDELDEKKTEQLKKILATIPKKGIKPGPAAKKEPKKVAAKAKATSGKRVR